MAADDTATVCLSDKNLTEIPKEILLSCKAIRVLDLSRNPGIQVNNVLRQFIDVRSLLLDQCALHGVLEEICELTQLEGLYLSDNSFFEGVSPSVARLQRLRVLKLSRCRLKSLPDLFGDMKVLAELCLDGNNFAGSLNPNIGRLLQLTKLNLSRCGLQSLPATLGDLKLLEELNLSGNDFFKGINPEIFKLYQLTVLDLSHCFLRAVPDSLGDLVQLQDLYLNDNGFVEGLNPVVGRLFSLKKLQLTNCELKTLPDSLGNLQKLKELYIANNAFSENVIPTIERLSELEKLHISGVGNYACRDSIGNLKLLEELDFSSNNFGINVISTIRKLSQLKSLKLGRCSLENVPDSLEDLKLLETLDLSSNRFFNGLAVTIGRLHQLKMLNLRSCNLSTLPDALGDLHHLEKLDLSVNTFANLNPTIGRLASLKDLQLVRCGLTAIPDSLGDLQRLEYLDLSSNRFCEILNPSMRRLRRLKALRVSNSELTTFPDWLGDLEMLEELDLSRNCLSKGVSSEIGRLQGLKSLLLQNCRLRNVPDAFAELKKLEVVKVSGNLFVDGVNSVFGRLPVLKTLDLSNCQLLALPDSIGDLDQLEELHLAGNKLSEHILPIIGRLHNLKKLDLRTFSHLRSLTDPFVNLQLLETLNLAGVIFSEGLNPVIGRIRRLKTLELSRCGLRSLPESLGDLDLLCVLRLRDNRLDEYPQCTLRMKNLQILDLSNDPLQRPSLADPLGNCIKQLPVELAFANLIELKYYGNPISEPPEEIWTQGLSAIKSFMRALIPGGELMITDTVNMIGDTDAGKTSVAQSLVARWPTPTKEPDRTRVMDQLRMNDGTSNGQSVIINDFGGHEVYHSVIPIFLPTKGLMILVFNMADPTHEKSIKDWLSTVIAKSGEYRIIVVGTRSDEIPNDLRLSVENRISELSKNIFREAAKEVFAHMQYLDATLDTAKLSKLRELKSSLEQLTVPVVTMSCLVPGDGLMKLCTIVKNFIRGSVTFPVRWCRVIQEIMKGNSEYIYLTMDEVSEICKLHFTADDDTNAMITILRYLAKTSQIFWLEDHTELRKFIFYSPYKVIAACKSILQHDCKIEFHEELVKEYNKGFLHMPLCNELLADYQSSLDRNQSHSLSTFNSAEVIMKLLCQFNIVSPTTAKEKCQKYIMPSNLLPTVPVQRSRILNIELKCLFKVTVKLTFTGKIIPLSFFETSQSAMLSVATDLENSSCSGSHMSPQYATGHFVTYIWKHGLIIVYDEVYFLADRDNKVMTLTAFTNSRKRTPWILLHPILRKLNDNIASSWHGAPPFCHIACPRCRSNAPLDMPHEGRIITSLKDLATCDEYDTRKPACEYCFETILRCLCFPTASESLEKQHSDINDFFGQYGNVSQQNVSPMTTNDSRTQRAWDGMNKQQLQEQFLRKYPVIISSLTKEEVNGIVIELHAKGMIITSEKEEASLKYNTPTEAATYLCDIILKKKDNPLFFAFIEVLKNKLNRDALVAALITSD